MEVFILIFFTLLIRQVSGHMKVVAWSKSFSCSIGDSIKYFQYISLCNVQECEIWIDAVFVVI